MKKVWIIAIGILLVSSAFIIIPKDEVEVEAAISDSQSEGIEWYDWNTGFAKARKEGKMAIIDCYTDWCGWCKVMDKKTFTDSAVQNNINEYFVPIKFNPEEKGKYIVGEDTMSGKGLLRQLAQNKFGGYPTIFIFVPQNARMFQHPGYQEAEPFNNMLVQYVEYQKGLTSN
ncbi:DUF255 domain-containing protein [bacterium]|nr:DUF255 domain-containing protein [bacterium]